MSYKHSEGETTLIYAQLTELLGYEVMYQYHQLYIERYNNVNNNKFEVPKIASQWRALESGELENWRTKKIYWLPLSASVKLSSFTPSTRVYNLVEGV